MIHAQTYTSPICVEFFASTDVDYALKNLFSYVRSNDVKKTFEDAEHATRLEDQAKILEMDDIVDDDSSLEESVAHLSSVAPGCPCGVMNSSPLTQNDDKSIIKKPKPARVSVSPREVVIIDD